jgi:hypothetical protein
MQTWTDTLDVPRSLLGYALWLEVKHDGTWRSVSPLGKAEARYILRWLSDHPTCTTLRIRAEKTG